MKFIKSDKTMILIAAAFVMLTIVFSFISNRYESRVMGDAALGVAVFAPERGSPEWEKKQFLRSTADCYFNLSIFCGAVAVLLDLFIAFRKSDSKSSLFNVSEKGQQGATVDAP
jgi:hypothetical protein